MLKVAADCRQNPVDGRSWAVEESKSRISGEKNVRGNFGVQPGLCVGGEGGQMGRG